MKDSEKQKRTRQALIMVLVILSLILIFVIWKNRKGAGEAIAKIVSAVKSKNTAGNNVVQPSFQINRIIFASNGSNDVYVEKRNDKYIVIINGQESRPYDSVALPTFSEDGQQFAYSAQDGENNYVVVNNEEEIDARDGATSIIFNPDGSKVGFIADTNGKKIIIYDGKETRTYDNIVPIEGLYGNSADFIFSPDGKQIAFRATDGNQTFIVINGQEGTRYDSISNFIFSPDGNYSYDATKDGITIRVINGKPVIDNSNVYIPPTPGTTIKPKNDYKTPSSGGHKDENLGKDHLQISN